MGLSQVLAKIQALTQAVSGVSTAITDASQLSPSYDVLPSAISVTASPFSYQNTGKYNASVIIDGGTVSAIDFSRDGSTFYTLGVTAGMVWLSPSDTVKVTYTAAPTMTLVPR